MPHSKREKEKKSFQAGNLNFLKNPLKTLISLKDKNIYFNPNPSSKNKNIEKEDKKRLDYHVELVDQVDKIISDTNLEEEKNNLDVTNLSPLEETIEFRDHVGRKPASSELKPDQFEKSYIENQNMFISKENQVFDEIYPIKNKDYSGVFFSKGLKLKLGKNKDNKKKNEKKEDKKTKENNKKKNSETKSDEDLDKEIKDLKKSIDKRKKSLEEKEENIGKYKEELEEIDQKKNDIKKDFEYEKKILSQEEKELKKLEKKIEKIDSKKNKKEEKTKTEEKKQVEKTEETDEGDLIAEVELDEPLVDEDVKKLIPVLDELLGELPDEIIDDFANSENFELYKKVVGRYKSK